MAEESGTRRRGEPRASHAREHSRWHAPKGMSSRPSGPWQSPGHHRHRAPLQALTQRSNVPTSEGTRSPPTTLRRLGPLRSHGPLLGWVRTPGSREEARERLGGRGRRAVYPPLTQRHRHRDTQQSVNSGALWQPHAVFKGTRGTPWEIPSGKELDEDYGATASESRAGFWQRSLNSCAVCVQKP